MNKIRNFFSGISINWLMIGGTLLVATLAGFVISAGKQKTLALLLLPTFILLFRLFSERLKFWLLALSIPLSLVQIPFLLPYGFFISEIVLVLLSIDELLFIRSDHNINLIPLKPVMIISLGLFTFAGLVTNLRGGDINSWNDYCLMPLFWFFLAYRKIRNREDAWVFIKLSLFTILFFVVFAVWANATGHFEFYFPASETYKWRLGYGQLDILGPIKLRAGSTTSASLVALGFPGCVLLWLRKKGDPWWGAGAPLILMGFIVFLIFSASRGAAVAAVLGTLLVLLVSGRYRSPKLLVTVSILLIAAALWSETILNLLPRVNIQRLQTLLQGVQNIDNFNYRMNVWVFVWKLTIQNPLGVGFGYLWSSYRIDDAFIYGCILEGTGILGALAFMMIVGQLAINFNLVWLKSPPGTARDLTAIGLGTLVVGLVAGVSSPSILFEPLQAFVFWALMSVCYCTVVRISS